MEENFLSCWRRRFFSCVPPVLSKKVLCNYHRMPKSTKIEWDSRCSPYSDRLPKKSTHFIALGFSLCCPEKKALLCKKEQKIKSPITVLRTKFIDWIIDFCSKTNWKLLWSGILMKWHGILTFSLMFLTKTPSNHFWTSKPNFSVFNLSKLVKAVFKKRWDKSKAK